jgi:transcriptional regulator with XRE-family HTH domain
MPWEIPLWSQLLICERKRRCWSQEEVAERLGVEVRSVRNWEAGTHAPRYKHRRKLARLYRRTLEELHLIDPETT